MRQDIFDNNMNKFGLNDILKFALKIQVPNITELTNDKVFLINEMYKFFSKNNSFGLLYDFIITGKLQFSLYRLSNGLQLNTNYITHPTLNINNAYLLVPSDINSIFTNPILLSFRNTKIVYAIYKHNSKHSNQHNKIINLLMNNFSTTATKIPLKTIAINILKEFNNIVLSNNIPTNQQKKSLMFKNFNNKSNAIIYSSHTLSGDNGTIKAQLKLPTLLDRNQSYANTRKLRKFLLSIKSNKIPNEVKLGLSYYNGMEKFLSNIIFAFLEIQNKKLYLLSIKSDCIIIDDGNNISISDCQIIKDGLGI